MESVDIYRPFLPLLLGIGTAVLAFYAGSAAGGETLWDYLALHRAEMDVMDMATGDDEFFIAGARGVTIPWESDSETPSQVIVPPSRRNLLLVMNATKREQNLLWQLEYPALPDVHEVYSIAATARQQLCVVYGPMENAVINPLMLRLDNTGRILWFKRVFPPPGDRGSHFLPGEQIANLDAIRVAANLNEACLLALVTRSVESLEETFRLHLIQYDIHGNIGWHKISSTLLYGQLHLSTAVSSRHFVVQTNLSRDAALQAMILGQPFVPQIQIATVNSEKGTLQNIHLKDSLGNAWLNDVIAISPESLLLAGKKGGLWLAYVHADGRVLTGHVNEEKLKGGDSFQAIAARGNEGFVAAHENLISFFDTNLHWQSTANVDSIATHNYYNPRLASQLSENLEVEYILPLSSHHYLLFYQYGGRLVAVDMENPRRKLPEE